MILDNEKQRENLLAMIATATLAPAPYQKMKQAVMEMEELENAVKTATISE
jgi:hypothetical protein